MNSRKILCGLQADLIFYLLIVALLIAFLTSYDFMSSEQYTHEEVRKKGQISKVKNAIQTNFKHNSTTVAEQKLRESGSESTANELEELREFSDRLFRD